MKFSWAPVGVTRNGVVKRPHSRVGGIPQRSEKMSDYLYEHPVRKPDPKEAGRERK